MQTLTNLGVEDIFFFAPATQVPAEFQLQRPVASSLLRGRGQQLLLVPCLKSNSLPQGCLFPWPCRVPSSSLPASLSELCNRVRDQDYCLLWVLTPHPVLTNVAFAESLSLSNLKLTLSRIH